MKKLIIIIVIFVLLVIGFVLLKLDNSKNDLKRVKVADAHITTCRQTQTLYFRCSSNDY